MTPDGQLYQCSSCDRQGRGLAGDNESCEFCGGVLRSLWGLAQLAPSRPDRDEREPAHEAATPG